ncbi:Tyrosine-protein kinase [Parasponia andersonii]|uniref:Tyrosine-protein kinase n=1 Tax=Parasponia andersonii TaxID=3476 RepID=A0A2P5A5A5_PARAD|nr:Tyrosine-protein kinase [Parasponia andersonii]
MDIERKRAFTYFQKKKKKKRKKRVPLPSRSKIRAPKCLSPLLLGFHGFVFLPPNPRTPPSSSSGFDFAPDFSGICPALIPPAFDWRRRIRLGIVKVSGRINDSSIRLYPWIRSFCLFLQAYIFDFMGVNGGFIRYQNWGTKLIAIFLEFRSLKADFENIPLEASQSKKRLGVNIQDVRREVGILERLNGQPNIVEFKGVYEDRENMQLVVELCSGGELFHRIIAKGSYLEREAARIFRQIVNVVHACHSTGVMHRDLENFLLVNEDENSPIKATNFGDSVFIEQGKVYEDIVGSGYYVAPEVLRQNYEKEIDVWSTRVILYILLSGVPPFSGETEKMMFEAILEGKLDLPSSPFISASAKDHIVKMLQLDPRKRITSAEALQHPWLKEAVKASDKPIDRVVVKIERVSLAEPERSVILETLSKEDIPGLKHVQQCSAMQCKMTEGPPKPSQKGLTEEEKESRLVERVNVLTEPSMPAPNQTSADLEAARPEVDPTFSRSSEAEAISPWDLEMLRSLDLDKFVADIVNEMARLLVKIGVYKGIVTKERQYVSQLMKEKDAVVTALGHEGAK